MFTCLSPHVLTAPKRWLTVVFTAESPEAGPGQHTTAPQEMSLLRNECPCHADITERSRKWQVKEWIYRTSMATGK